MTQQTIFFDQVPNGIRKPGQYFEYNNKLALRGLPGLVQKVCIIGQKTASGSVAQAVPTQVFSPSDAVLYSGMGSMVHRMVLAAFAANPNVHLTIVNLDDSGSAFAAGTVTFATTATSAGILTYRVGKDRVEVAITSGMTPAQLATALVAAIAARPELPITAAVDGVTTGEVDITAKNAGTLGNQILHSATITATGITAAVVALADGAVDPDIDTALASIYAVKYDKIVSPYNNLTNVTTLATYSGSAVAKLRAHILAVSGPTEQRRCMGVIAQSGALALTTTLATSANFERFCLAYMRGVKMWTPELAAAFAATWALRSDPAMPLNSMEVKGVDVPLQSTRLSRAEQETLLAGGVTPLEVRGGDVARIVRAVTTYLVNASSTPDASYLDVTTMTALDYGDQAIRDRIALRFTPAKASARVRRDLRSETLAVMYALQEAEIWREIDAYKDQLIIEDDPTDPTRWNMSIPAPVVPGLHVIAGQLVLHLSPAA